MTTVLAQQYAPSLQVALNRICELDSSGRDVGLLFDVANDAHADAIEIRLAELRCLDGEQPSRRYALEHLLERLVHQRRSASNGNWTAIFWLGEQDPPLTAAEFVWAYAQSLGINEFGQESPELSAFAVDVVFAWETVKELLSSASATAE